MQWMWTEASQCKWTVAMLRSTCLAVGVALQLSAVRGESEPEASSGIMDPSSSTTNDMGGGGKAQNTVATTVGFVVVLFILVMAVLMTILLCIRHGICPCPGTKPPPSNAPVTPASRMAGGGSNSRVNRSPLVSSSSVRSNHSRSGGHSTHSPNSTFPHHSHHHHYHHSHHHHSHHSSHTSPRRHNGHAGGTSGNNSGPSIGGSSGYSQHHHNMRSASMDPPLPTNISPYPGMPFPYQPCKSPGGGVGYAIHPQIPRTPTSASITTLSSLSTPQNQRHTMGNGIIVSKERGGSMKGDLERPGDRGHAGGREREGSDRKTTGDGQGGRGGARGDEQRKGDSGGRGRTARRGKEERGGREGTDGGERETIRSSGDIPTDIPVPQRQVESSSSHNNSSPLQLYSTQV